MKLIVIAAIARNRAIGKAGQLPWHIPEDLHRFKRLTTGHTVLMGRKTFEALGRPLPNRRNVVVSSKTVPGAESFTSVDDALKALADEPVVFAIGGGQVYAQLLHRADELDFTIVDREVEADTFFPPYEELVKSSFRLTSREEFEGFAFVRYVRNR